MYGIHEAIDGIFCKSRFECTHQHIHIHRAVCEYERKLIFKHFGNSGSAAFVCTCFAKQIYYPVF